MGEDTHTPEEFSAAMKRRMNDLSSHNETLLEENKKLRLDNQDLCHQIEFWEDVKQGYNKDHSACVPKMKHRMLITGLELLKHELQLSKAARDEFLNKYEAAEKRCAIMWDRALEEARTRIGHHTPACAGPCFQCWCWDELGRMKRGDSGNYVPIKERIRKAASQRMATATGADYLAYCSGIIDMVAVVEEILPDTE